jgi:hypothetical protein
MVLLTASHDRDARHAPVAGPILRYIFLALPPSRRAARKNAEHRSLATARILLSKSIHHRMETPMNSMTSTKGASLRPGRVGRSAIFAMGAAAALASAPATSQRGDRDADEPRDCITLMEIDRTRVADDDTILFYMRGGDVYRNELPNRCPTLEFEERFMYRVTTGRLCSIDVITVIDDVGFGFMPGASCGLGEFEPISEEEADELTEERRDGRNRNRN